MMLGLDAAGKTTILYKLHIGEVLSTVYVFVLTLTLTPTHSHTRTHALAGRPSGLMSKRSSTKTCSSRCGTSAVRRSCGRCGVTTSITPMR